MMHRNGVKALVLAAGVGTRLDPLTKVVPKPLVPIGNRPVMEHVLRLLKHHNISAVLDRLGMIWLKGYVPRHNFQQCCSRSYFLYSMSSA